MFFSVWITPASFAAEIPPEGAHRLPDGSYAVPLIGEGPDWLTPEVWERTVAAGEQGLAYDYAERRSVVAVPAPSGILVRPGTLLFPMSIFPGWCTAGFVFNNGARISTAGHCTKKNDTVLALTAPTTVLSLGKTGALANSFGNDWALINIDPLWQPFVDPSAALVGGPCGRIGAPAVPLLKYVGHGAGGTPRIGLYDTFRLALPSPSNGAFAAIGAALPGDSGAPVLETTRVGTNPPCAAGAAVGILTHGSEIAIGPGIPTVFFFGTPISKIGIPTDATVVP